MSHILILGGGGFIGSNIARKLLQNGHKILIFDSGAPDWDRLGFEKNGNVEYVQGDFSSRDDLSKLFENFKVDSVYHTISTILPSSKSDNIRETINTNLYSTIYILELMKQNNCRKIVYISSGGSIYGINGKSINKETDDCNPINEYGWLKLTIEKFIKLNHHHTGLNYLIIRPSNVYGIGQNPNSKLGLIAVNVAKTIKGEALEVWGNGEIVRDYLHIDDLSRAIFSLVEKQQWNEVFNVGSGKGHTINQVLKTILETSHSNISINYTEARKVDVAKNILDISKIKNRIGWLPEINLKDGISQYFLWLSGNTEE